MVAAASPSIVTAMCCAGGFLRGFKENLPIPLPRLEWFLEYVSFLCCPLAAKSPPSQQCLRLQFTPVSCAPQDMLEPPRPYSETIMKFVTNVLPFAALALVYVATQVSSSRSRSGSGSKHALAAHANLNFAIWVKLQNYSL
jgi:hypothetical protein